MSRKREARLVRIASAKDRRKDRRLAEVHELQVGKLYSFNGKYPQEVMKRPEFKSPGFLGNLKPGDLVVYLGWELKLINASSVSQAIVKVIWKDVVGHVFFTIPHKKTFRSHDYFRRLTQ